MLYEVITVATVEARDVSVCVRDNGIGFSAEVAGDAWFCGYPFGAEFVITSYSIHYTKLYDTSHTPVTARAMPPRARPCRVSPNKAQAISAVVGGVR